MQVNIGSALTIKGQNFICIEIEQINKQQLAKEPSSGIQQWVKAGVNVRHLDTEIEDFEAGDAIEWKGERLMLECPGVDLLFIWTSLRIAKLKEEITEDEQRRVEGNVDEGAGAEIEEPRGGTQGGEGHGEESVGEIGGAVHSDGQGGEGGVAVPARDGEGT